MTKHPVSRYAAGGLCAALAALGLAAMAAAPARAEGDMAAYEAAVPALKQAMGGKPCECFLSKYAPAEFNKALAVSPDGAYGGRWSRKISLQDAREAALKSCRKKPQYDPAHPCVIFMENDRLVWKP